MPDGFYPCDTLGANGQALISRLSVDPCALLVAELDAAILVADSAGRVCFANAPLVRLLGSRQADEPVSATLWPNLTWASLTGLAANPDGWSVTSAVKDRAGAERLFDWKVVALAEEGAKGPTILAVGVCCTLGVGKPKEYLTRILRGLMSSNDRFDGPEVISESRRRCERVPAPAYTWRAESDGTLRLIGVNSDAREIGGGRVEQALQREVEEIFPSDSPTDVSFKDDLARCLRERSCFSRRMEADLQFTGKKSPLEVTYSFQPPDCVLVRTVDTDSWCWVERDLARSAAHFRHAQQLSRLGSWVLDPASGEIVWGEEIAAIVGVPAMVFERTLDAFLEHVHPDDRETVAARRDAAPGSATISVTYRLVLPGGQIAHCLDSYELREDPFTGQPLLLGTMQNVTEPMEREIARSLEQQRAGLQEVNHRVFNSLQMVSSMMEMQIRRSRGVETTASLLRDSQARIVALARIYQCLHDSSTCRALDFAEYCSRLSSLWRELVPGEFDHRIKVESLELEPEVATACGLIVHELVVNSMRHGYPQRCGVVELLGRARGTGLVLQVRDWGCGFEAETPGSKNLGLTLVELLAHQHDGTVDIESEPGRGTTTRVLLPAVAKVAEQP